MMVELPGSGVRLSHCKPDIVLVVGTGWGDGTRQPAPPGRHYVRPAYRRGVSASRTSLRRSRDLAEPQSSQFALRKADGSGQGHAVAPGCC